MFTEKNELNLDTDQNETMLVELNAADVDDVSGGLLGLLLWPLFHRRPHRGYGHGHGHGGHGHGGGGCGC